MTEPFGRKPRPPGRWTELFRSCVEQACHRLDTETLRPLGLKTLVLWDHPLAKPNPKWCAVYLRTEDLLKDGVIAFTFNLGRIYSQSLLIGKARDPDNIRMQAEVLTAHETAHGLIDFIRRNGTKNPGPFTKTVLDTRPLSREEEDTADEFGRFFSGKFPGTASSVLDKAVGEITQTHGGKRPESAA